MRKWRIVALVGAMVLALIGGSSAAWADDPSPSPTGSISGVVTTDTGASAEGVQVIAVTLQSWGGWAWAQATTVGADGTYSLSNLSDGDYRIEFTNGDAAAGVIPQYWPNVSDVLAGTTITVAGGSTTTDVNATLVVGGAISGTVTSTDGSAVVGGMVSAVDSATHASSWSASTNFDGTYRLTGLPTGSYLLQFQPGFMDSSLAPQWWDQASSSSTATAIRVVGGQEVSRINPILEPAGSITGVVTSDAGTPAPDIMVSVYQASEGGYGDWMGGGSTDATGAYSVGGLPAGAYKIQFSSGGTVLGEWYDNAANYEAATPVTVLAGASSSADAVLTTGATVTGKVTDGKGSPVENVMVMAQPADGTGYASGTSTAADGTYAITGLEPGAYKVQFDASNATQNVASQWWKGVATAAKAKVLQLAAGAVTSGVNARLDDGASISGVVRDDSGAPVAGVYVTVYDAAQQMVGSAWTAADGSYTVRGLPGGDLRLRFNGQSGVGTTVVEWWKGASTITTATPITVKTGQTVAGVDVNLSTAGGAVAETWNASLSGVLTDGLGHPIAGAAVTAESAYMGDIAQTDANGAWSIPWLAAGSYRISFTADVAGAHIVQWWNGAASRDAATPVALGSGEQRTGIDASLGSGALPSIHSAQPKITGQARVGALLKANPGSWTTGTKFTYEWFADGAPLGGQTAASLTVTQDLQHKQLTVLVTGTQAGYQGVSRSSAPTVPVAAQ